MHNKTYSVDFKKCANSSYKQFELNDDSLIVRTHRVTGSSSTNSTQYSFSNTGGQYQKIRIELSDFSDYFEPDGTHSH